MSHHPIICVKCKHHLDVQWDERGKEYDWVSIGTHSKFCAEGGLHERGRADYFLPDVESVSPEQEAREYEAEIDHLWRNR